MKPLIEWIDIASGTFRMGCADGPYPEDGEGPERNVMVDGFHLSACAVSNEDFGVFVNATGFRTDAEERGFSYVFEPGSVVNPQSCVAHAPWWVEKVGACWRQPAGDGSKAVPEDPVVHVSYRDAQAYCEWSGYRLPTEAEWEYAARGGLDGKQFPWGDELEPDGVHRCNVWQGAFPQHNTGCDGFAGLAPVRSYPANGYGLYNMTGNTWEWCSDRFTRLHGPQPLKNPQGPLSGSKRVMKGGSFLCHHSYCLRYRVPARTRGLPDASAAHIGFRVACAL